MPYEMKDMSGSLFLNDRKQKPSHPDYQGSAMVAGKKYRIAGWRREAKSGTKYLSLALTLEEAKPEQGDFVKPRTAPKADPDFNDDPSSVPF